MIKLWKKVFNPDYQPHTYETVTKLKLFGEIMIFIFSLGVFWCLFPIWCISRLFYFSFPIFSMIIHLNDNDNGKLNELQLILTIAYWFMFVIWFVNFLKVLNFYYWMHHIVMGRTYMPSWRENTNDVFDDIYNDFNTMASKIIVNKIINDVVGTDIGSIIFDYWSNIEIQLDNQQETETLIVDEIK